MAPRIHEVAAGNDAVHFAEHVVKIAHRLAAIHLGEFRRFFRLDIPAMRDAHAGERYFLLVLARVHHRPPKPQQVRVVVDVEASDAQGDAVAGTGLSRGLCGSGGGERRLSQKSAAIHV
jgi:hypothetical protein